MITTIIVLLLLGVIGYIIYRVVTSNTTSTTKDSDDDLISDDVDIYNDTSRYRTPTVPASGMETMGRTGTSGSSPGIDETEQRRSDYDEGLFPIINLNDEGLFPIINLNDEPETTQETTSEQPTETPFDGFNGEPTEFAGAGAGGSWDDGAETRTDIPAEYQATSDNILDLPEVPSPVTEDYVQSESVGDSGRYTPSTETSSNDSGSSASDSYSSNDSSSSSSSSSDSGYSSSSSSDSGSYSSSDSVSSSFDSGSSSGGDSGGW